MNPRYTLAFLFGAVTASGWWASSIWFWGVPLHNENGGHTPVVGIITVLLTIVAVVLFLLETLNPRGK